MSSFLKDLLVDPDGGFQELLPIDDLLEPYLDTLTGGQPGDWAPNEPLHRPPLGSSDAEMSSSGASTSPTQKLGSGNAAPATKEKKKRWKNRTYEQWVQNKLAQKQYRLRKKEHVQKLEVAAAELAEQVAQLSAISAQTAALEDQNAALEANVRAKEAEITQARSQSGSISGRSGSLQSGATGPSMYAAGYSYCGHSGSRSTPQHSQHSVQHHTQHTPTSSCAGHGMSAHAEPAGFDKHSRQGSIPEPGTAEGGLGPGTSTRQAEQAQLQAFIDTWTRKVKELRAYLESVGLREDRAIPNDEHQVDAAVNGELRQQIQDTLVACIRAYRLEEPDLAALAQASYAELADLGEYEDPQKWLRCAEDLNFSPSQRRRLLERRAIVLPCFQRLYAERERLNVRILKLLLPGAAPPLPDGTPGGEQGALMEAVAALEANLAEEQQRYSEEDYILFNDLLTPAQGAWLHVKAFPDHCDPFPLMAAVLQQHPEDAVST